MRRLDARTEQYLLGRPIQAGLSEQQRRAFAGRRVLITGAGGSVGGELARQVADCQPEALVLLDHSEYALFTILRDLGTRDRKAPIVPLLADVTRPRDISAISAAHRPDFVFHAAACKHVTIAEQAIVQAIRTNVLGAVYVARAAERVGARFVLISTDKAAEPRSVMGATKRLAELLVLDGTRRGGPIAVRFGNVLGSSGSVVEILMDAARAGRPLPVTDPDATRFFMTASEAVSLVLKTALSGLAGDVCWLDMGPPLRLADLVERVLDVVSPAPAQRSVTEIIGLRPGEKLHEELTTQGLEMQPTEDPAIWRARQAPSVVDRSTQLLTLRRACTTGDAGAALHALRTAVPDYEPSEDAMKFAAAASHMRARGAIGQLA